MRQTVEVREYMSRLPEEIDRRETLATALERMTQHHVRHIPVMDGATIFGVLSRRDALLAWVRHGHRAGATPVGDVCTRTPLQVSPIDPIPEVAERMLAHEDTSALVTDGGMLVGIFTSTDALRILAGR